MFYMGTQLPLPKGTQPPTFRPMYCGQVAGWIKMPLGTEVGLGPGHIVLDGDPATLPQFLAHLYCGQTVTHLSYCYCWVLVIIPVHGDVIMTEPWRVPTFRSCHLTWALSLHVSYHLNHSSKTFRVFDVLEFHLWNPWRFPVITVNVCKYVDWWRQACCQHIFGSLGTIHLLKLLHIICILYSLYTVNFGSMRKWVWGYCSSFIANHLKLL